MARKQYYLKVTLDGAAAEDRPESSWLSARPRVWFRDLVYLLRRAAGKPSLRCVWMVVKANGLSWNQIEELHLELDHLERAGKETVVFLETAQNRDYYLACGFQKVFLTPSCGLELVGLRSEMAFFSDALEWAGVQPHVIQVGRYKSAGEIFTRTGFSEASRDMLDSILEDLQGQLVARISKQRDLKPSQVRELIDSGPFTSGRALKANLIDGICYEEELEDEISASGPLRKILPRKLLRREGLLRRLLTFRRPQIAYIVVEGLIKNGRSSRGPGRGAAGSDTVRAALQRARKAKRVVAVVLRINSPGGSALASDLMWHEAVLTDRKKPVIVSMGSEAASGGYYLAVGARYVYAMPGSLTGSIGVLGGKFNLAGLLRALRVSFDSIDKGSHAGYNSITRPFDPQEETLVRALAEDVYSRFLDRVEKGRSLDSERVAALAEGRVWTGRQAAENGLVDAVGGVADAIQKAREEAHVPPRRPTRLVHYRERRKLRDLLPLPLMESLSQTRVWTLNPFRWKIH